jgi:lipid-binding SYLF domain-containing protein
MRTVAVIVGACISAAILPAETARQRLGSAASVLSEIMATPDKGIPADLIEKSECIIIVPSLIKGAFIVGGQFGRGFVNCRRAGGRGWGAPAAIRIEGGSFGLQIGGQSTDLVMLVMNRGGMEQLTKSKFTLGGDASVAAGPVGRNSTAQTDATMNAEILSWSRAKGLFGGVSVSGATLRGDEDTNKELYGRKLTTQDIIMSRMAPPPSAARLMAALNRTSNRRQGTAARSR